MRGSSGLNTQSDAARSTYSKSQSRSTGAQGIVDFSACMNVDISDKYRVSRRRGITRQVSLNAHSLYPVGERYCLFVSGPNLNLLLPSLTEYETVATVTPGMRLSCFVLDGVAYWSNRAQQGKIIDGANVPWAMGDVVSNNKTRVFYDPPNGKLLGYYNGRAYIVDAQDSRIVWYSEEYGPDVFALGDSFLSFESSVIMLRPVSGGIYVGEHDRTWFLSGADPQSFIWGIVDDHMALPYSDKTAVGTMIENKWLSGGKAEVAFWLTNEGVMFGDSAGQVQNITETKIDLPTPSTAGAILVDGSTLIAQFI